MKIGICIENYTTMGGVERVSSYLYNLLKGGYFDVEMISFWESKDLSNNYFDNIPIKVINKSSSCIDKTLFKEYLLALKLDHIIYQMSDIKSAYEFLKIVKECKIRTHVVFHNSPFAYFGFLKKSSSLKDQIKFKYFSKPFNQLLLARVINMSANFVCVGESIAEELRVLYPSKRNKITFVNNPLHIDYNKKILEVNEKENIVIYGGRLTEIKQVDLVLAVWKKIQILKKDWKFYILGDGPFYDILHNKIINENIEGVKMKGNVSNTFDYLNRSKICILFSLFEGFPTILLEAAYFNNALIINDGYGGSKDIAVQNFNSLYCKNSSLVDLYESFDMYINDSEMLTRHMINSKKILENFSNDKILKKWTKLLTWGVQEK